MAAQIATHALSTGGSSAFCSTMRAADYAEAIGVPTKVGAGANRIKVSLSRLGLFVINCLNPAQYAIAEVPYERTHRIGGLVFEMTR